MKDPVGFLKSTVSQISVEKQETILKLAILTCAAILC